MIRQAAEARKRNSEIAKQPASLIREKRMRLAGCFCIQGFKPIDTYYCQISPSSFVAA